MAIGRAQITCTWSSMDGEDGGAADEEDRWWDLDGPQDLISARTSESNELCTALHASLCTYHLLRSSC